MPRNTKNDMYCEHCKKWVTKGHPCPYGGKPRKGATPKAKKR